MFMVPSPGKIEWVPTEQGQNLPNAAVAIDLTENVDLQGLQRSLNDCLKALPTDEFRQKIHFSWVMVNLVHNNKKK